MRGSDILRIKRWLFFRRFIIISGSFVCSNTLCELFSLLLSFRRVYWVLLCFLGSFCPTKQEFYCVFTWWLFFFCSNEPIGPLNCGFTRFYRVLSAFGLVLPGFTWFFIVFFFGQEDLICFVVVFWCVWSRSAGLAVGGARGGGPVETIKKRMEFFHSFFFWCGHFFCRYRTDNDLTWGDGFRNGRRRWNEKPQRRRRHRRRAVTSIVVSCRPDDDDNDGDDSLLRWLVGRLSSVYDFAGRAIDVIGDSIISKRACRRPPLASLPGFFFFFLLSFHWLFDRVVTGVVDVVRAGDAVVARSKKKQKKE